METSDVDTSILSSLHSNRFDYLRADDKEPFGDSAFLTEDLDKDLPKTLPELSDITDSDSFLRNNEPSQMMTIDSSWWVLLVKTCWFSCFVRNADRVINVPSLELGDFHRLCS